MKQIVAIGGTNETNELGLEKYILSLTGKTNPKVCLLMQASAEDAKYIAIFYDRFLSLGATPSNVSLFGVVKDGWKEKLLSADVIYVGGGNTKSLMALWRDWGVDKVLKQAYENGTIMCGSSAGGICWFEQGCTDSIWPLGVVNALGFLNGSFCPHLDTEKERDGRYTTLVNNQDILAGIALHENTAAYYIDGKLHKYIKSTPSGGGYKYEINNKVELDVELIEQS